MTLGEKLKQLRTSRFMTQQKLADELGISQSAIAAYERDFREPDFATVKKIADYFHVTASSLLPSSGDLDADLVQQVTESFRQNPKIGQLFDKVRFMTDTEINAVLAVVNAISRENNGND